MSKTSRARVLKFCTRVHRGNISKTRKQNFRKGAWPRSRDPKTFGVHPNVSPKRLELVTWHLVHRCTGAISQKPTKENPEKGRGLGHVTPKTFGVHPNVCPKRVELESWNFVRGCIGAISQKPANKTSEKGRGLGHVTPKLLAYTLTYLQSDWS